MEKKKPTNAQLQNRISKAVIHIDRTKDTKEVFFDDRGIRIVISDGKAIISQLSFMMAFDEIVSGGYSRNYMVLNRIAEMVDDYDCIATNEKGEKSVSFWKLYDSVKNSTKEWHEADYGIITKFIIWFSVMQSSMFLLSERADYTFALGTQYAMNGIISGSISKFYEKDMTNKELLSEIAKEFDNYRNGVEEEFVVMKKETEEDRKQAIANAMQETLLQKNLSDVIKDKQYEE
jgi:hypothetical protein